MIKYLINTIVVVFSLASLLCLNSCHRGNTSHELTVSAAISLKDALDEILSDFTIHHPGITVTINYGSSGSLQQQIENGAPVDIFLSAAAQQMDALEQKGLLLPGTRINLLTNRLLLVAPLSRNEITSINDLVTEQVTKLAIGEPKSVPVGTYAREVLTSLGMYETVRPKLIYTKDVRQVLSYVETANVDAGFVYATDAINTENIKIIAILNDSTHSPILYPVAVLRRTILADDAKAFVAYLTSDSGKSIFEKYGFIFNAR